MSIESCNCALIDRAAFFIQKTMEVRIAVASKRDQAFKEFLLTLGEFAVGADKDEAHGEANSDRGADPDPHHGQPLRAAGLLEIARDNADDQRGFDRLRAA